MSIISKLSQLIAGVQRQVDLSTNTLAVGTLRVGGVSGSDLSQTILDRLISLQNGSDVDATYHTHDTLYTRSSDLAATSGDTLIGDAGGFSNFTPSAATVRGALEGIDSALGASTGATQLDGTFRIENTSDNTKKIAFDASAITTGTTRTLKMADANVDLANLTNSNISASAAIAYSKLALSNSVVNADIASAAAIALNKLAALASHNRALVSDASGFIAESSVTSTELGYVSGVTSAIQTQINAKANDNIVIKKDGSVAFTADQSMGGNKLTNLADPTSAQDAVSLAYMNARLLGLKPKQSVRTVSLVNIDLSVASDPSPVDGVTLADGDRVLLAGQTAPAQNGIYVAVTAVDPTTWTRSTDFDSVSPIDEINGAWVPVEEGNHAGATFVQYGLVTIVGTDPITFNEYNPIASLVGGDMISISGSTISVDLAAASGLESSNPGNNAGQLRVKLEASNPSLKFTGSNELAAKLDTAGAIVSGASGLKAQTDGSTLDINGSNQLEVKAGGITNTQVSASAGIVYSKLSLANSIVNADIASGAAIAYSKLNLSASIVNADIASGAAIAYSKLALSNSILLGDLTANSVDENKIVSTTFSASGAITGGSGTKVAVAVDNSSIEISTNALRVKSTAYDQATITGGSGSAAAVAYAPKLQTPELANESLAATTLWALRYAKAADAGFVAGRLSKADIDATSVDNFYVVGLAFPAGSVSSGGAVNIVKHGIINVPSHGFTVGAPLFLDASGAVTATAPSTVNMAVVRVGMVKDANNIDVQIQVMGVN